MIKLEEVMAISFPEEELAKVKQFLYEAVKGRSEFLEKKWKRNNTWKRIKRIPSDWHKTLFRETDWSEWAVEGPWGDLRVYEEFAKTAEQLSIG